SNRSGCISDLAKQENVATKAREHTSFVTFTAMARSAATPPATTIATSRCTNAYRLANQLLTSDNFVHLLTNLFQSLGSLTRCDTPIAESLRRGIKARIHAPHGRRGFFDLRTKAACAFACIGRPF